MKQVIIYIFSFAFLLGFANADTNKQANDNSSVEISCPYLQSISVEISGSGCPYLIEKSKSSSECPYQKKRSSGGCPFSSEMKERSAEIKKESQTTVELKTS